MSSDNVEKKIDKVGSRATDPVSALPYRDVASRILPETSSHPRAAYAKVKAVPISAPPLGAITR